jgi:DNA-binding CsgD family transcriptional regulator
MSCKSGGCLVRDAAKVPSFDEPDLSGQGIPLNQAFDIMPTAAAIRRQRPQSELTRERQAAASGKTAKLSVEEQYLDAAPRKGRRPGYVFKAPWRGLPERPWFDALFVSGSSMAPPTLPSLPLSTEHWKRIAKELELSPQQKRIAELILRHQCDKQIAAIMGIKQPTVRTYIGRMFVRLKVRDREELILMIFQRSHERCHRE